VNCSLRGSACPMIAASSGAPSLPNGSVSSQAVSSACPIGSLVCQSAWMWTTEETGTPTASGTPATSFAKLSGR